MALTPVGRAGGVSATDGTYTDKVHVSWNSVSGADTYQVFYSIGEAGDYVQIAETTETSFDDTDDATPLLPCITYWYKVRACNAAGCSDLSDADEGWRETRVTGVPTNVTASDGTYSDKVSVSWDAVTGADKYLVYRSENDTGPYTLQTDSLTTTSYEDTSATPGVTYWYKIQACSEYPTCDGCQGCNGGCGGLSIPESGYACAPPPEQDFITALYNSAENRVELTWDMTAGLGYKILRATDVAGPYTDLGFATSPYFDTTVQTNSTYWYKLRVCNDCDCTDSDPPVEVNTATP